PAAQRAAQVQRLRAVARGHQPQYALGPPQEPGGCRHRGAALLRATPAARGISAHRKGPRTGAGAARAQGLGRETYAVRRAQLVRSGGPPFRPSTRKVRIVTLRAAAYTAAIVRKGRRSR